MQCPVCHNEVGSQSTFCNHCGASLSAAAPAPGFTEVPPPTAGYSEVPAAYTAPPQSGYAPPPGYAQAPPQAYPGQPAAAASSGLSANSAAAIAYITFIPAIIFLVIEPYNKTPLVRFHSFQSIALAVVWFGISMVLLVLSMFFAFIPFLRVLTLFLFPLLHLAIFAGMFILWILAIMKASKGEFYKLPVIGDFAMKQAQS